jgi:hypothetical protein
MNVPIRFFWLIGFSVVVISGNHIARSEELADGLLGSWQFNEGQGLYSANTASANGEAELHNVAWVRGKFGTAIRLAGKDSFVTLPHISQLDGANEMSIAMWVYWEGTGKYPNLLTGGTWSPGGFLFFVNQQSCSFRMGRPGHKHGVPGEQWREISAPFLDELPLKTWVHLTAVFHRPNITTYVNGRKVGTAKWDDPVGHKGDIQLGRWAGSACHRGLIDDVRIYGRALSGEEVSKLADDDSRNAIDYDNLGLAKSNAQEIVRAETRWTIMSIGDDGTILSLKEKATGRELIDQPVPIMTIQQTSGHLVSVRHMRCQNDVLLAEKSGGVSMGAIRLEAKNHYFVVTPVSVDIPNAARFTFFQLSPSPRQYVGRMAGLASDDASGVCMRSLALEVDTSFRGTSPQFRASTTAEHGLLGHPIGLAAGPRQHLTTMLRAMADQEPVPKSDSGGPWSLESEATRGSYLFANLAAKDVDAWIELARRGGFTNIHLHGWWNSLGHYSPRPSYFPHGLEEMKATAEQIRSAGLVPGMHTLTACISTNDEWVTPVPSQDLIASHRYTLAQPLSLTDTKIYVNELPAADHDLVWSYAGNGNALRVGSEIIRYSKISRTAPYAFLDCERGAFKTQATKHPQDASVDYLQQRYLAFYPEPNSPLAAQLADKIARVFNECGMEMIYFDGSEGMRSRFGIDTMRWEIFQRLEGGVTEASEWGHNSWWFHSRLGAWDHPVWGMKQFHDHHIRLASRFRKSDLLQPQLGWWAPRGPSNIARGQFPDEMEYFAAKNLSIDGPMSIQGVHATATPWNARMEEMLTILGWYERLRLARYFDAATLDKLSRPGDEFRLRQAVDGQWQLTPTRYEKHRISGIGSGSEKWSCQNVFDSQPLRMRLESLYSVASYDDTEAATLIDFTDLDALLENRRNAAGVHCQCEIDTKDTQVGGRSLHLIAHNANDTSRGAWSQIGSTFEHPYVSMMPGDALGLWVQGDGSGAVLNIQLRSPREHHACISDHYVDLDFRGWRYVELLLRERDAERLGDYVWPYSGSGGSHAIYRNAVDRSHLSEVNIFLNEIPAGGTVDIRLSPIRSLNSRKVKLRDPELRVGHSIVTFPVTLESGQYLEMEEAGTCLHYDERGELLRRFQPQSDSLPVLPSGTNRLQFDCLAPVDASARAEVTVVTLGEPFGTRRHEAEIDWARCDREYDIPHVITQCDPLDLVWSIYCRPNEAHGEEFAAMLEVEIRVHQVDKPGAAGASSDAPAFLDTPTLTIGGRAVTFPTKLSAGQRLVCRDLKTWHVRNADGTDVASGKLPQSIPHLAPGPNRVELDFASRPERDFRVEVRTVKRY